MIQRQGDWLTATVGDELVMMSATKGNYIGLDAICAELVKEFDVTPEVCRAEVEAFIADLGKHGAVAVAPG